MYKNEKIDKQNVEDIIALSPIQEGMIYHYLENPDSKQYFEQLCLSLSGHVKLEIIKKAWDIVAASNEMLRTVFRWEQLQRPVQIVLRNYKIPIRMHDISSLDRDEKQKILDEIKKKDSEEKIDITSEPLRITLCKLEEDKFEMIISNHHILYDGWSSGIILKELFDAYNKLYTGSKPRILVKNKYKEFVKLYDNQDKSGQEKYWGNYLQGFDTKTTLPDNDNKQVQFTETKRYSYTFEEEFTQKLNSFVKKQNTTLASLLYASWGILLQRYNNTNDVVFGTTVSGRSTRLNGMGDMVGLFINTIPLRIQTSKVSYASEMLQQTGQMLMEREDYESTSLVDIQSYSSFGSKESLFDSIVVMENYPLEKLLNSNENNVINITSFSTYIQTNFDLTLGIEIFDSIKLNFIYNEAAFGHETIQRLANHFVNILLQIMQEPNIKLSQIEMLSQQEKEQVLFNFNCTGTRHGEENEIIQLFNQQLEKNPEDIAVVYEDKKLTYGELNKKATQLAAFLREKNVGRNNIVGLMTERSLEMIIGIMGILKAGGAYLPIAPDCPTERVKYMLEDSGINILLTHENLIKQLKFKVEMIDIENEDLYKGKSQYVDNINRPEDLAYVIYTSGSTGKPKGVMIERGSVVNLVGGLQDTVYEKYDGRLKVALIAPYIFDASVQQIFASLLLGHALYIVPEDIRKDGDKLAEYYKKHEIDISDGTPMHISMLANASSDLTENVKVSHFIIGGEELSYEVVKGFYNRFADKKPHITNVYGPTECCVDSTSFLISYDKLKSLNYIPIGIPMSNTKVYILGKGMEVLPVGAVGEIYISGPSVGRGYLNMPELTNEKYLPNPFINNRNASIEGERMYKTGDIGIWTEDGNIKFLGRIDNQVKIRGYRIELGEIVSKLLNYKKTKESDKSIKTIDCKDVETENVTYCSRCLIPSNYPDVHFDKDGVCSICHEYETYKEKAVSYFKSIEDFRKLTEETKKTRSSEYDCLLLYSGGKDSSYVLYKLVDMGLKVLTFTFDNGYISEGAFKNIKRVTSELKVDNIICKSENMNDVFAECLKSDHTVCTGCFKALTAISTKIAVEKGINLVITGLSRGQIFDTKLHGLFKLGITNIDEIEEKLLLFRKTYHSSNDKVDRLLNVRFDNESVFDNILFVDFFRYDNTPIEKIREYLTSKDLFWSLPSDTGFCSTNCLINDVGIYIHLKDTGYHNYAAPLSWGCRLGQDSREEALKELKNEFDFVKINRILEEIGYMKDDKSASAYIKDAVVLDKVDENGIKYLCAYIVSDEDISVSELRSSLLKELPDYMVPSYFMKIDKIPLTQNGKIDRRALPEPELNIRTGAQYVEPRNDLETRLAELWGSVLGVDDIGIYDNFLELGGHSLKLMTLALRIRKELSIDIPIKEIFKLLTIEKQAEFIDLSQYSSENSCIPCAEAKEYYPMSSAQKRIYLACQLDSSSTNYNISGAMLIEGKLDKERMGSVFAEIVNRHESFRTSFETIENDLVQRVRSNINFQIEYETIDEKDLKNTLKNFVKPFSLNQTQLLRVKLLELDRGKHMLVLDTHHIIFDGMSLDILIKEITDLYTGKQLPQLKIQYKDFSVWQNKMISDGALRKQEEYWLNNFAGEIPVLNMPIDFQRPSVQAFDGNNITFEVDTELTEKLKRLTEKTGTTMYMVLLAAYNVLLSKYTGQSDIVVGSPIAGRLQPDLQCVIGMFVNTLAMRNYPQSDMKFKEFLASVKENALKAYENQDYQFEQLLEKLNIKSDISRNPLFDTVLAVNDVGNSQFKIEGMKVTPYQLDNTIAKFDLTIIAQETDDNINVNIEYCTKLFRKTTIERLGRHFLNILLEVANNCDIRLADIDIMSPDEKSKILMKFNDTKSEYQGYKTIHELFEEQVERTPDNISVISEKGQLTYRELNHKANQLAHALREKGVKRNSFVGVVIDRSIEMIIAVMGILKAGGAYVPLEPYLPEARIQKILHSLNVESIITNSIQIEHIFQLGKELLHLKNIFCLNDLDGSNAQSAELPYDKVLISLPEIQNHSEANLKPVATSEDRAYVIFTSGSTGLPKGVVVKHKPVINLIEWVNKTFNIGSGDKIIFTTSLSFDLSVYDIFGILASGASIRLALRSDITDPKKILDIIMKEGITFWDSAPAALQILMPLLHKVSSYNCKSQLRLAFLSGDWIPITMPAALKNAFNGVNVISLGGATEATVWSNYYQVGELSPSWVSIPYGKPIQNAKYYILDKHLHPCTIGVTGDLYIGGECLASGYINDLELTANKFIDNPFESGEKIYKTGDIARWFEDGNMEFLGRKDHQIKIRGFRIEIGEIETHLLEHTDINDAIVIAREDGKGNKYLCAYIISDKDIPISELRSFLLRELPEYMIPTFYIRMESFPLSPNGKIDRKAFPEVNGNIDMGIEYAAPQSEIERKLAEIWSDILEIARIGINDNFFDLGGQSLKASILTYKIHEKFNVTISLRDIFANATIKELAKHISLAEEKQYSIIKPVDIRESYPASSAQKRIYIAYQLENSTNAYNISGAFIIEGKLDRNRTELVFNEIIARHESFRTSFQIIDGELLQRVNNNVNFAIEYSKLEQEDIEEILNNYAGPFDLEKAPLLRVKILEYDSNKHILLIDTHHIIMDGVSVEILIREFVDLYGGMQLPKLKIQYKDFTIWQNEIFKSLIFKKQEDYWVNAFRGEIPILNIPTDYPRPSKKNFQGDSISFKISKELADGLNLLAKEMDSTIFMVLLSAFNIFLSKYSCQNDIVIGSPIAGRSHSELQNVMGMFVNTLALRNYPNGEKTFRNFLCEVKENALNAYDNQNYQFEELVEKLNIERDTSRNPLFNVMFIFQSTESKEILIKDLKFSPLKINQHVSKFNITLTGTRKDDAIEFDIEYSTELFKKETIERMSRHFSNILQAIIENSDIVLSEIDMLSRDERQQILYEFNNTYSKNDNYKDVHELFEEQVLKTPDSIAVIYENTRLTYRELNKRSNQVANMLRNKGVSTDTVIGVFVERSVEMIIGIMGILKSGGAYLPIDPDYPQERINYLLANSRSPILLTKKSIKDNIAEIESEIIAIDEELDNCIYSKENLNLELDPERLMYVLYTSGSTGNPKGVMVKCNSFANLINWFSTEFNVNSTDNILLIASASFDLAQKNLFASLIKGGRLCLFRAGAFDYIEMSELLQKEKITIVNCTPSAFYPLIDYNIDSDFKRLSCLKWIFLGGESINLRKLEVLARSGSFKGRIANTYGPTECTDISSSYTIDTKEISHLSSVPIGKPIYNVKLYILDRDSNLLPVGVAGELHIGGIGVSRGYYGDPGLSEKKFVKCKGIPEPIIYKTGDMAKWMPDGNVEFIGRIDYQVKVRGFRIEIGEIEERLIQFEDIKEAIVIDKEDKSGSKFLCAYFVATRDIKAQALRDHLKSILPDYMIPSFFIQIEKFPLTLNGKIDRRALPEVEANIDTGIEYVEPQNETEKKLVEIWRNILEIDHIGINDNFFSLGGHSLKATVLASQIHELFNINISLGDIFANLTIKELAKYISLAEESKYSHIEPIGHREFFEASSSQKRMFILSELKGTSYNMPQILILKGPFDVERAISAFKELVKRHEVFRTSFKIIDGEIVQIVNENVNFDVQYNECEECRLSEIAENFVRLFDLTAAPLLRVNILKLGQDKHALMLDMHHTVSDGVSMNIFVREFAELYEGKELPALTIQYKDYAAWHNRLLQSRKLKTQKEYWLNKLNDFNYTELPKKNVPSYKTTVSSVRSVVLDKDIISRVDAYCKRNSVTKFVFMLSVFEVVVSKEGGNKNINIGVPVSGREYPGLENLIGVFINTLIINTNIRVETPFSEFVNQINQTLKEGYSNQDYQYEDLHLKIKERSDFQGEYLFSMLFNYLPYQDYLSNYLDCIKDVSMTAYGENKVSAKYDITLYLRETIDEILLDMVYKSNLYDGYLIERILNEIKDVIEIVLKDDNTLLLDIALLKEDSGKQSDLSYDEYYDNDDFITE